MQLKDFVSEVELSERNSCVSMMRREYNGSPLMMAVTWIDRDRRYFISTTSKTLREKRCCRLRSRQIEDRPAFIELSVPQAEVCEIYYSACAKIDRHKRSENLTWRRMRGSTIGSSAWRHISWQFLSLIAGCCTGALAEGKDLVRQLRFYELLAIQLIENAIFSVNLQHQKEVSLLEAASELI